MRDLASPFRSDDAADGYTAAPSQRTAPAPSDEEAALAQSLKLHFAAHPRKCKAAKSARKAERGASETTVQAPEEVTAIDEALSVPTWQLSELLGPAGEASVAGAAEADAELAPDEPAAEWVNVRQRSAFRERLASAVAWTTTLLIVLAVVGGAAVGLIGYQRCLALAQGALSHVLDWARAAGLIQA